MTDSSTPSCLTIYQFASFKPGPKLIVLGAVHGNETCGTQAIERIRQEIANGAWAVERGTLTLVPITNPLAYQLKRRHGDRNLNRMMRVSTEPQDFEDQVSNVLCPLLQAHDILLDLHSFHRPGVPFALIGPTNNTDALEPFVHAEAEEALALSLGVSRFVEGWLKTYAQGVAERQSRGADAQIDYGVGTTETMRRYGGLAVTLECGQHDDPHAPEVAYQAIRRTLAHLKMAPGTVPPPPAQREVICLDRVIDRLHPDDRFARDWQSFEALQQGDLIAHRHDGTPLLAPYAGWIVFPNPSAQVNQEWFYLARPSERLAPA